MNILIPSLTFPVLGPITGLKVEYYNEIAGTLASITSRRHRHMLECIYTAADQAVSCEFFLLKHRPTAKILTAVASIGFTYG
jgi:hypothetical protein